MKRGFSARKFLFILLMVCVGVVVFGSLVMLLWNAILPDLLHVSTINFWQSIGLLLLCKILFGGFKGGWQHKKDMRDRMKEKWKGMTPDEREKFRNKLRERCGSRWPDRFRDFDRPAEPFQTPPTQETNKD